MCLEVQTTVLLFHVKFLQANAWRTFFFWTWREPFVCLEEKQRLTLWFLLSPFPALIGNRLSLFFTFSFCLILTSCFVSYATSVLLPQQNIKLDATTMAPLQSHGRESEGILLLICRNLKRVRVWLADCLSGWPTYAAGFFFLRLPTLRFDSLRTLILAIAVLQFTLSVFRSVKW